MSLEISQSAYIFISHLVWIINATFLRLGDLAGYLFFYFSLRVREGIDK